MGRGRDHAPPRPASNARSRHLRRRDRPSRSPRRRAGRPWSRVDREGIVLTSAAVCSNPSLVEHLTKIKCDHSRFNQGPSQCYDQADLSQRNHFAMPEQETIERARKDEREGKAPSTLAGEFVREEMEHIREGKHGARSAKQAIAIGLSKARRAGVKLPPPKRGSLKKQAARDSRKGKTARRRKPSRTRSRAVRKALKREPHRAASHRALSRQARSAARRRTKASRSRAGKKAARTRKRKR